MLGLFLLDFLEGVFAHFPVFVESGHEDGGRGGRGQGVQLVVDDFFVGLHADEPEASVAHVAEGLSRVGGEDDVDRSDVGRQMLKLESDLLVVSLPSPGQVVSRMLNTA